MFRFHKIPECNLDQHGLAVKSFPPFESWVPYLEAIAASSSLLPFVKFTAAHDLAASTEHDVPASVSTEPHLQPPYPHSIAPPESFYPTTLEGGEGADHPSNQISPALSHQSLSSIGATTR